MLVVIGIVLIVLAPTQRISKTSSPRVGRVEPNQTQFPSGLRMP